MTRYFTWWIALLIPLVAASLFTSIVVFRHIDLRTVYVAHLLAIPAAQALVLTLATGGRLVNSPGVAIRSMWADPFIRVLVLIDLPLVAIGWLANSHHTLGFAGGGSVQPAWMGTKAIVAGFFLIRAAAHNSRGGHRVTLARAVLGLELIGFGLHPFSPWLDPLSIALLGSQSQVARLLVTHVAVFWLGVLTTLWTAGTIRARHPAASDLLEIATAPAFVAGLIVVQNGYMYGFVVEPWATLALTLGTTTATCLVAAAMLDCAHRLEPGP